MPKAKPQAIRGRLIAREAPSGEWVRLSDPSMKTTVADMKKITMDPTFGLKLMVKAGVVTKSGNLTKKYAGGR